MEYKVSPCSLDLPLPTFVPRRYRPGNLGNWSGHLAFANDLIAATQPSLIAELGTHYGESYFGFCQSVVENGVNCMCYAVDHWLGEAHAGVYGEEVFTEVAEYNHKLYKDFSYLLRTSFDDAATQFSDESIGLLHIDGLHTYEAGSHDFRTWLPKVKPGGIILLHDIVARHADFGIWRLWQEIEDEFPEAFAFHHSWGLGVVRKPGGSLSERPALLDLLFGSPVSVQEYVRRHYAVYASHLENILRAEEQRQPKAPSTHVKLYRMAEGDYSEGEALFQEIELGDWKTVKFDLEAGIGEGRLRIDPAQCPGVIEINRISVSSRDSSNQLWAANNADELRELSPAGTATALPDEHRYLLFSYAEDPQLILPVIEGKPGRAHIEVSLKVDPTFNVVAEALGDRPTVDDAGPNGDRSGAPVGVDGRADIRLYISTPEGYSEEGCLVQRVPTGQWSKVLFELPEGAGEGPLRVDPGNFPAVVEIGEIAVLRADGSEAWRARDVEELSRISPSGTLMALGGSYRFLLFSHGEDPQLILPRIEDNGKAIRLEISLRIDRDLCLVAEALNAGWSSGSPELQRMQREIAELKTELAASQAERMLVAADLTHVATERNEAVRATKQLEDTFQKLKQKAQEEAELAALRSAVQTELAALRETLDAERAVRAGIERSLSWRVTKPVRSFMERRRSKRQRRDA